MSKLYVTTDNGELYSNLSVNLNQLRVQRLTEVMQNLLGLDFNMDVNYDIDFTEVNFYFLIKRLDSRIFQALKEEYIIKYFESIITLFEIEDN